MFSWAQVGGTVNSTDRVTQTNVATGNRAVVGVPARRLAEGSSYFLQVQSNDGTGTSPISGRCEFTVDTVAPDAAPVPEAIHLSDRLVGEHPLPEPLWTLLARAQHVAIWKYDNHDAYNCIQAAVRTDPASVTAQQHRQSLPLLFAEKDKVFVTSTIIPNTNGIDRHLHHDPGLEH